MSDFLRQLNVRHASNRVTAAREALRRAKAKEPAFDHQPNTTEIHWHFGALQAHVELLAEAVETLLPGGAP